MDERKNKKRKDFQAKVTLVVIGKYDMSDKAAWQRELASACHAKPTNPSISFPHYVYE